MHWHQGRRGQSGPAYGADRPGPVQQTQGQPPEAASATVSTSPLSTSEIGCQGVDVVGRRASISYMATSAVEVGGCGSLKEGSDDGGSYYSSRDRNKPPAFLRNRTKGGQGGQMFLLVYRTYY
jgi:hypothetical protein